MPYKSGQLIGKTKKRSKTTTNGIKITRFYKVFQNKVTEHGKTSFFILIALCVGVLISELVLSHYAQNSLTTPGSKIEFEKHKQLQDKADQKAIQQLLNKLNGVDSSKSKGDTHDSSSQTSSNDMKQPYKNTLIVPDTGCFSQNVVFE